MIKIYGHSDDLVEIEGDIEDELCAYEDGRIITIGGEGEGVVIRAEYAPEGSAGVWRFSVELVDDGVPCRWKIEIEPKHEYSQQVVIHCPPGTPVDFGDQDDEEDED